MKPLTQHLLALSSLLLLGAGTARAAPPSSINTRIFGTRAIVACDPVGHQCGIAVISFPTGITALVPYGRSDLAVATMALPSVDDAQAVIARIDGGAAPQAAIDSVLAEDPYGPIRQLAAVKLHPDGSITLGQTSGNQTADATCSVKGATYVVQANNMSTGNLCQAMADGFEHATGSFPRRLLQALQAGARVGGDKNGERSGVVRVWNTTADSAFYTHVLADAVVNSSYNALEELDVQLHRYLGVLAVQDPADRIALDKPTAKRLKKVLHRTGYYEGPMDGTWSNAADTALAGLVWNNCFFEKPTTVVNGTRMVDGPLVRFILDVDPRALAPATSAP
ncbi:DUF1028 domain-containing protein [Corallococcus sp. M34]|uniref:DUF1028 domain-containing protein n=1 Tax=Citreicoccus inhibens TaxID=2849499 RepID=UPI001C24CAF4|nr:DUF1028 domain-containing protein [Citreicoccus inhibens]MBU8895850.1 DUF1028 domain-containing protein [Citreicoccus inhibens]